MRITYQNNKCNRSVAFYFSHS